MAKSPVEYTAELGRILALPRRDWTKDDELVLLGDQLFQVYGREGSTMRLRPIQVAAIRDAHDQRGAFLPMAVGAGKTLPSFLIPVVMGAERPLLLVPAKLRDKTQRDFRFYRDHWWVRAVRTESYEGLGRVERATLLEDYQPDLIIADEAHKLKNRSAAVTRRVERFVNDHEPMFVAMSGSFTNRSLMEYAHIARWCLGDQCFLPRTDREVSTWSQVLDVNKRTLPAPPGPLAYLMGETPEVGRWNVFGNRRWIKQTREAYRDRMFQTPGVVATAGAVVDTPIEVRLVRPPDLDQNPRIMSAFNNLRDLWETPDGHPFAEAYDLWRHARELVCGFYYRWNPRPPKDWLAARKEWCAFVRKAIQSGKFDSMLQVARACAPREDADGNTHPPAILSGGTYEAWQQTRDTFKPNTETVWIDDATLKFAQQWLDQGPGICWVEHVGFGRELARRSGHPYYGRGGLSASGQYIEAEKGSLIASIGSNHEGRNLQTHHWRNLVVSAPCNGVAWEQLMGRTHRPGQAAKAVTFDIVVACSEQLNGFRSALADAEYIQDTQGVFQKLLKSVPALPSREELHERATDSALWRG